MDGKQPAGSAVREELHCESAVAEVIPAILFHAAQESVSADQCKQFPSFAGIHMAEWIEVGATAPKFTLPANDGTKVRLADLKGKPVVLYFYPKDDTPGCTKEACAFRDRMVEFEALGACVFGVSPDGVDSHQAFSEKFDLNFPLLADTNHVVAIKYGAWRERNRYGRKFMGIQRSTFIIDVRGKIARMWKAVQVDGHDDKVLDTLRNLADN